MNLVFFWHHQGAMNYPFSIKQLLFDIGLFSTKVNKKFVPQSLVRFVPLGSEILVYRRIPAHWKTTQSQSHSTRGKSMPPNLSADAFEEAFVTPLVVATGTILWLGIVTVGNFLVIGTIFGVYNDQYRTLVRLLYSRFLMIDLLNNNFALTSVVIRIYWGPFPEQVCYVLSLWHGLKQFGNVLFAIEAVGMRLLYCMVWKNMGMVNDDFMVTFLSLLNVYFTFLHLGAELVLNEGHTTRYFLCLGVASEKREERISALKDVAGFFLLCLLILTHVMARMKAKKMRGSKISPHFFQGYTSNRLLVTDSITTTEVSIIILIVGGVPEIIFKNCHLDLRWNSPCMSFVMILALFLLPFIGAVVIPMLFICKEKSFKSGFKTFLRVVSRYCPVFDIVIQKI